MPTMPSLALLLMHCTATTTNGRNENIEEERDVQVKVVVAANVTTDQAK